MSGSRTLKLSILADIDNLKKNLSAGDKEIEGFGSKLGDFGKKAAVAFGVAAAAAAAYAGKLLIDGVKSAIEDEAAQEKLRLTLIRVTDATEGQIESIDDYITKTSIAFGVTDDQLRPSLERLARATGSLTEAQKAQSLALDIAAGTGKSLEAVSNALGKAYEGNTSSLGRLGIGLSSAELKTMSMADVTAYLANTFGGQASVQADTFQGKMERLKIAFSEAQETVGSYVLSAITPLVEFTVNKAIPALQAFSDNIGGTVGPTVAKLAIFFQEVLIPIFKEFWTFIIEDLVPGIKEFLTPILNGLTSAFNKISKAIKDNEDNLRPLFNLFKSLASFILSTLAPILGKTLGAALEIIGSVISRLVTLVGKLVGFFDSLISSIMSFLRLLTQNPILNSIMDGLVASARQIFGGGRATGGAVTGNTAYMVGERGPELFVPNSSGQIIPNDKLGGGTVIFNISGAIDPVGTARQINEILNSEAAISGSFLNLGQSRFAVRTA